MERDELEKAVDRYSLGKLKLPERGTGLAGLAQVGLSVIAVFYVLHEMKPVLLPLILEILVAMIVHPVYLIFRKMRIPRLLRSSPE